MMTVSLVVLDTNVLFAGLWSRLGLSFRVLELLLQRRIRPALSVPLVLEYEMVLKREMAALGLTPREIDAMLDYLCAIGHQQKIHFLWRPALRDPRDELVLELAVAAGCPYILTHNVKDYAGSKEFGVEALSPAAYLRHLGERS
jgi:putative PIN family toxin of toxin-antitoxin system